MDRDMFGFLLLPRFAKSLLTTKYWPCPNENGQYLLHRRIFASINVRHGAAHSCAAVNSVSVVPFHHYVGVNGT